MTCFQSMTVYEVAAKGKKLQALLSKTNLV